MSNDKLPKKTARNKMSKKNFDKMSNNNSIIQFNSIKKEISKIPYVFPTIAVVIFPH